MGLWFQRDRDHDGGAEASEGWATAENSHLQQQTGSRNRVLETAESFGTSKATPTDTFPPTRPHRLILPQWPPIVDQIFKFLTLLGYTSSRLLQYCTRDEPRHGWGTPHPDDCSVAHGMKTFCQGQLRFFLFCLCDRSLCWPGTYYPQTWDPSACTSCSATDEKDPQ